MILDFPLTMVREGTTRLIVPADHSSSGPSTSDMPVFYNPQMEFNRDVSVAMLGRLLRDGDSFLDGLAASGARGIRVAKECGKRIDLHMNDSNPLAFDLMGRNARLNGVEATATNEDLRTVLASNSFGCIDIDPFGSPVQFFPMAISALARDGLLCVTATDTGTISGIFTQACLRKYGCEARRTPFCHEIGTRNLIGFVAREAAKTDHGIKPIMSYQSDHYVRSFIRISKGAKKADESLESIGYCRYDAKSLERDYTVERHKGDIGPIWIGQTVDPDAIESLPLPPQLRTADKIQNLTEMLRGETKINRPFFTVDEFTRKYKFNPPKMDVFMERLEAFSQASRTHYEPKSFRTDASVEQIVDAMKKF